MKVNEKIICTEQEVLELINNGVNPLNYIQNDNDIDLICKTVANMDKSEDSYWDDMAEVLLKSIIYYLNSKQDETKSLKRCKEIVENVINSDDKTKTMKEIIGNNESANVLYKPVEIALDNTRDIIFDTLNKKLSKII